MSRGSYALRSAVRVLILVALTIAFPFVLRLMLKKSGCGNDTCGALSLVLSLFAKPAIYIVFVLSFIGITMRRLRDAGIPVWIVVALPLLFLADLSFAMAFGAPWTVGFVMGMPGLMLPKFMLTALACIVFLSVVPGSDGGMDDRRWGLVGIAALCLLLVVTAYAMLALVPVVSAIAGGAKMLQLYIGLAPIMRPLAYVFPYAVGGLVALLVILAWQQRSAQLRSA